VTPPCTPPSAELRRAALTGDAAALRRLLGEVAAATPAGASGGEPWVDEVSADGSAALAVAASHGQLEVAKMLLEGGAAVNLHPRDSDPQEQFSGPKEHSLLQIPMGCILLGPDNSHPWGPEPLAGGSAVADDRHDRTHGGRSARGPADGANAARARGGPGRSVQARAWRCGLGQVAIT
jgi:hypothetical protein